jgi:hypothetical protein
MDFKLNLLIKEPDLRIITTSGLKITIAKPVGDGSPNVAWLVFDPFMANTVEWSEEYGLYASTSRIDQGAVITRISEKPPKVTDGESYVFGKSGTVFDPGDDYCEDGSFRIKNLMGGPAYPSLTFGLTQTALINNNRIEAACINAAVVPSKLDVIFKPLTRVFVWLQSSYCSGTVITTIMSTLAEAVFGGGVNENSLVYDSGKGHFIPAPNGAVDKVLVHKPVLIY